MLVSRGTTTAMQMLRTLTVTIISMMVKAAFRAGKVVSKDSYAECEQRKNG